MGRYISALAT